MDIGAHILVSGVFVSTFALYSSRHRMTSATKLVPTKRLQTQQDADHNNGTVDPICTHCARTPELATFHHNLQRRLLCAGSLTVLATYYIGRDHGSCAIVNLVLRIRGAEIASSHNQRNRHSYNVSRRAR